MVNGHSDQQYIIDNDDKTHTSEATLSISTASSMDRGSREPITGACRLGGTSVNSKQGREW